MTKRKTPQGNRPQQKKSTSLAPASKGREESRAVATRRQEDRTAKAQRDPDKLARVYAERMPKVSKDRFTRLTQKETESTVVGGRLLRNRALVPQRLIPQRLVPKRLQVAGRYFSPFSKPASSNC